MLKTLMVSAALVAGASTLALVPSEAAAKSKHVAANGRCKGVSYGTGARSCGTKTGGPVGGNSSRN